MIIFYILLVLYCIFFILLIYKICKKYKRYGMKSEEEYFREDVLMQKLKDAHYNKFKNNNSKNNKNN